MTRRRVLTWLIWIGGSVISTGAWATWNSGRWNEALWNSHTYVTSHQPSWLDEWDRDSFQHRVISSLDETESAIQTGSVAISSATYIKQPFEQVLVYFDANISTVTTSCSVVLVPYIQNEYDALPYRMDADAWTITTTATGDIRRALYFDPPDGEPYFWAGESITQGAITGNASIYIRPTED
jgi:hypothetical protein